MAESGEMEEIVPRGNDWEVVSLTASAYAAAPGPKAVEPIVLDEGLSNEEGKVQTSPAMFMSGHFVASDKLLKDVELGGDNTVVQKEGANEEVIRIESEGSANKDDEGLEIEESDLTEDNLGVEVVEKYPEIQTSTAQSGLKFVEPEKDLFPSVDETNVGGPDFSDGKAVTPELVRNTKPAATDIPVDVPSTKPTKDKKERSNVPCEPWWKRQAASLYDHVKEMNPLWSIFIAAAVMGLAVIGQRWHQRKCQSSPLNLQFHMKEEKPSKMLGPVSRLKDAFVSSNQGSPFARSTASAGL